MGCVTYRSYNGDPRTTITAGRDWRPLIDTVSAPFLYLAPVASSECRVDFYSEQTHVAKSTASFARRAMVRDRSTRFRARSAVANTGPIVRLTAKPTIATLNSVHAWADFFDTWLSESPCTRPTVYSGRMEVNIRINHRDVKNNFWYSIGGSLRR